MRLKPGSPEWEARRRELLAESNPGLWWLSFADESGSLGVAIIAAPNFLSAVERAHELQINPGGEVRGSLIDPEPTEAIPPGYQNRLLGKADRERLDQLMKLAGYQ